MFHRDLPQLSFIDPKGNNRQQIEQLIAEAVEVVLSYTTQAASSHPLPDNLEIGEDLADIPEYATAESTLLGKLQQIVETSMNAAHHIPVILVIWIRFLLPCPWWEIWWRLL